MAILSIDSFAGMDVASVPSERGSGTARHVSAASLRGGVLAPLTTLSNRGAGRNVGGAKEKARFLDRWWHGGAHHWVSWPQYERRPVHFVAGLIPDDLHNRAYWTGAEADGRPRMSAAAVGIDVAGDKPVNDYLLGVPRVAREPQFPAGTVPLDDSAEKITTAWVHTLVSEFGEEGPPSLPSNQATINDGQAVALDLPTIRGSVLAGRALGAGARRRIYRANTGTVATDYQFVGEIERAEDVFIDNVESHALGEVLPSRTWFPPPRDLLGLAAMPNGVLAGYSDDTLWFSEPGLPHAWPERYRKALDAPIVGIESVSVGLVVLTRGRPYIVTGNDPADYAPQRGDFPHGCVNGRSIVDMGESILYCAPDGLATISASGSTLLTRELVSSREWRRRYDVEKVHAFEWEGRYVALLDKDDPPEGGRTGFVFDPERGLSDLSWRCAGGYSDPEDGSLQLLGLER